jgi:hypothetical protein
MACNPRPATTADVTCSNCRRSVPGDAANTLGWGVVREGETVKVALCDECITALLDAE